jgi:recombinase-like zinc beta ribbon protein/recombinase
MEYHGEQRWPKTGKARARVRPRDQWPVLLLEQHPAYVSWEEFMRTQDQLRQNWQREGSRGVAREGTALLQGMVWCGHCGRKMGVQHHATKEKRSSIYLCQLGHQQDGEDTICQSMTAHPVDVAVTQAFLEAVAPLGVEVAVAVLDQAEQQLAAQRHQAELQLEQARYEARLAQRKYDAVDPDNRLVAGELERRWNAQLTRVAELEQAYAKAEQEARWTLTPEERTATQTLSQDLASLWHAETTTSAERKQLLRLAIESVQLDGVSRPGWIEIQIRWRTGFVTRLEVKRRQPGEWSLKTPTRAVARLHELATTSTYAEIAEDLNAAGWRTAFGRPFTSQHVGYICRRDGCGRKGPRSISQAVGQQGEGSATG